MHTYRIHREDEERRQLVMLALVAPLPGLFATPMARHKSKKSPERERERGKEICSGVSTGLWEYYTVLQCPEH